MQGLRRYSRHLLIPEVGVAGQERLAASRVLCVGAGGLGSPALQYLAAAGVGRIGIVDDDVVDESNLQRQTLFATSDIGKRKAEVAAERVMQLNPLTAADVIPVRLDSSNARDLIRLYDVVLDCTDRFETRYTVNDACWLENRPDVYASIFRFDGQVSVFWRDHGPCYRCLFSAAPPAGSVPTCAEGGVLGVLAGITGAFQANEALRDSVLLDVREPHEIAFGVLEGALHVPASDLPERLHELDSAKSYVVACRIGQKSAWATRFLRDAGFRRVRHLRGGLLAYAAQHPDFEFF